MKYWKEGLYLLPAVGLAVAAAAGLLLNTKTFPALTYPEAVAEAAQVHETEAELETQIQDQTESETAGTGNYTDGIYQGKGTGFRGDVKVEVTVKDGQISKIKILSYQDDEAFFQKARALTEQIIHNQTWEVDVVSGATYSSRGIMEAVKNALTGSTSQSQAVRQNVQTPSKTVSDYTGGTDWKDGTYTGTGSGYGGSIQVTVTIAGGKITDIQITSYSGETASYFAQAKGILQKIIAAQSPNVDAVSGATYSSNGIREAVIQALNKAGGTPAETETQKQTEEKKTSTRTEKLPKGRPANGIYSGDAICEQFSYTIRLNVKFKNEMAVAITDLNITGNEDKKNEAYWKKAWKPMVKGILKNQGTNVDVVSGATYSSKAILNAYLDAYKKAVKAGGGKVKETEKQTENQVMTDDVPAPDPAGTIRDGTYTVSAVCLPDENQGFQTYTLTADVVFTGEKLTTITNYRSSDESNRTYYLKAANGNSKYTGVVPQLLEKQSASGISAVSGATCSSKTIRTLYIEALTLATGVKQTEPVQETEPPAETDQEDQTESSTESESVSPKDGTYQATVTVTPDEWEEFADYSLTGDVTFEAGKLLSITNLMLGDTSNQGYCNLAANGTGTKPGVIRQLIARQNSGVDVIAGATCSSTALIKLYEQALEAARK